MNIFLTEAEANELRNSHNFHEYTGRSIRKKVWAGVRQKHGLPYNVKLKANVTPGGTDYLLVKNKHTGEPVQVAFPAATPGWPFSAPDVAVQAPAATSAPTSAPAAEQAEQDTSNSPVGTEIPPEVLGRLFDRFHQLAESVELRPIRALDATVSSTDDHVTVTVRGSAAVHILSAEMAHEVLAKYVIENGSEFVELDDEELESLGLSRSKVPSRGFILRRDDGSVIFSV